MKTTFLKSILALAFIASFTSSCVNDDDYETPQVDCIETTLQKTKEVSEISASSTVTQYLQNDVIEAYVVSSDKGGNFFKTISFQTKKYCATKLHLGVPNVTISKYKVVCYSNNKPTGTKLKEIKKN